MATKWNKIDKIMYENKHRQLSTREIADLSGESISNAHSKLKMMFKYSEVTKKEKVIKSDRNTNRQLIWQLKPRAVKRTLERMERFK